MYVHVHVAQCGFIVTTVVHGSLLWGDKMADRQIDRQQAQCKTKGLCVNNQVHRALFRKEGEGKERERTTSSTA